MYELLLQYRISNVFSDDVDGVALKTHLHKHTQQLLREEEEDTGAGEI